MPRAKPKVVRTSLAKAPTGIQGLDEVTGGGLPKGRVTLVCGSAGCGKSLLAMEFLVHGAVRYGEPGVCMDFEETEEKLRANVASLGFDLRELAKRKKLLVDYVSVERDQIAESGEYNLEGLFIRLGHAVKAIKAKRVVLDSIEALFSGLVDSTYTASGTPPAVSLAGRPQAYRCRYRGSGRTHADPSRAGGIHRRLRDRAGPPGNGTDFHPPAANRQVPGHFPRHR